MVDLRSEPMLSDPRVSTLRRYNGKGSDSRGSLCPVRKEWGVYLSKEAWMKMYKESPSSVLR